MNNKEILNFITDIPKTETHLHIEGALPYSLLQQIDPEAYSSDPESWAADFKWSSFETFEAHLLEHALKWYSSAENYHQAAKIIFGNLQEKNVQYIETSFHGAICEFCNIDGKELIAAILDAVPEGMEVKLFMGLLRNDYRESYAPIIHDSLSWEQLTGIDMHGGEVLPIEDWAINHWEKAKNNGKFLKAHAGEFGGASNVAEAFHKLGTRRIQHGIRAVEDSEVVQLLLDENISLDICPISNVKLDVVPTMADHPIRELFDAGVRCTISTDDPFSFGNTIEEEYIALAEHLDFTITELGELAKNGFKNALIENDKKQSHIDKIDELVKIYES